MQDTLYVRARRGELPDVLPHDEIALLATASLDNPHGDYFPCDQGRRIANRLETLIAANELCPERTELAVMLNRGVDADLSGEIEPYWERGTRYHLTRESVLTILPELGEVKHGLHLWLGTSGGHVRPSNVGIPSVSLITSARLRQLIENICPSLDNLLREASRTEWFNCFGVKDVNGRDWWWDYHNLGRELERRGKLKGSLPKVDFHGKPEECPTAVLDRYMKVCASR